MSTPAPAGDTTGEARSAASLPHGPRRRSTAAIVNRLEPADRPAHDWFRFVLSYPPHLVRDYVTRFGLGPGQTVLDPFSGTGTTIVECKKLGLPSVGLEAHPLSHFAATTKVAWDISPDLVASEARRVAERAHAQLVTEGVPDAPAASAAASTRAPAQQLPLLRRLSPEEHDLLLTDSISPLPLHKTLVLRDAIATAAPAAQPYLRVALAKALVGPIGNLSFGPEVGIAPAKPDAATIGPWLENALTIAADLATLRDRAATPARVLHADARTAVGALPPASIDAVITSPPYPNEKDYTRTTRLESVLLGFIRDKATLRALKQSMLLRSNTRGVYVGDTDDSWVADHPEIQRIAEAIEARRLELGKTSGFEKLYARVTRLYFGGMARHFAELRPALRPGARLAYVVGDQASFLRVMIRTGQLLASLAERLGYEVESIDLFRTRAASATREQLREEVVVLRWPGTR